MMDIDEYIEELSKTDPDVKDQMNVAKEELKAKREELGDELYNMWIASHFINVKHLSREDVNDPAIT